MHSNHHLHHELSQHDYHRLREAAKQRALQLRQEALRDIPGHAVRSVLRGAARWLSRLAGGHALHHAPCAPARS
ncbi:hypothetical protein [Acidovorax sp.]|uniref:hypothetical protein n=1 Tax=Acidovorax sp. TaxID=1872122 RepID=UPI00261D3897|nr:hypothetical protein [Acidovorax sp.]